MQIGKPIFHQSTGNKVINISRCTGRLTHLLNQHLCHIITPYLFFVLRKVSKTGNAMNIIGLTSHRHQSDGILNSLVEFLLSPVGELISVWINSVFHYSDLSQNPTGGEDMESCRWVEMTRLQGNNIHHCHVNVHTQTHFMDTLVHT